MKGGEVLIRCLQSFYNILKLVHCVKNKSGVISSQLVRIC